MFDLMRGRIVVASGTLAQMRRKKEQSEIRYGIEGYTIIERPEKRKKDEVL